MTGLSQNRLSPNDAGGHGLEADLGNTGWNRSKARVFGAV
jgi:hypothetical protein